MKKIFFLLLLVNFIFSAGLSLSQTENTVIISPQIIDEKARTRDILKYDLKLANKTDHKASLYPVVFDISENKGRVRYESFTDLDSTKSLARWITFTRGVQEMMPGDELSIPLQIDIPSDAAPGKYFAAIIFPEASNRFEAEKVEDNGNFAKVNLNITVEDNTVENVQIVSTNYKNIFFSRPVSFEIRLKNNGNIAVSPQGTLYIYDRRGVEVKTIPVGDDQAAIEAGQEKSYVAQADDFFSSGKFKARLELSYGQKDVRDLQDAMFFWIMPWQKLLIFAVVVLISVTILSIFIFKRTYRTQSTAQYVAPVKNLPQGPGVINLKK